MEAGAARPGVPPLSRACHTLTYLPPPHQSPEEGQESKLLVGPNPVTGSRFSELRLKIPRPLP